MMFLDLFPVGVYQLVVVLQEGLWYARSSEIVMGTVFQTLTYFRSVGGAVFVIGGLLPLIWFILSRSLQLRREVQIEDGAWSVYERDWAAQKEPTLRHAGRVDPDPAE